MRNPPITNAAHELFEASDCSAFGKGRFAVHLLLATCELSELNATIVLGPLLQHRQRTINVQFLGCRQANPPCNQASALARQFGVIHPPQGSMVSGSEKSTS